MTTRPRTRKPPLESGAVETQQVTTITPSDADVPIPQVPLADGETPGYVTQPVGLTGPEQAELRMRNDTIDWAREEARKASEQAMKMARLADMGQAGMTAMLRDLLTKYNLDPSLNWRADIERGVMRPDAR